MFASLGYLNVLYRIFPYHTEEHTYLSFCFTARRTTVQHAGLRRRACHLLSPVNFTACG